ncbi:MAG: hypothetical protein GF329_19500 [Candidatus Lokiarchaeota archaeon]|nr:hypothetical protein [Candidatus Lokiarchaeota archaeon]
MVIHNLIISHVEDKQEIKDVDIEVKDKNWLNKKNIIFLITLGVFITILVALAISGINLGEVFITFTFGYESMFGPIGVYLALFIISIFANMTIIFPVPYTMALSIIVFLGDINPLLLGIAAGSGAAIGEITAYYVGRGSASLTDTTKSKALEKMKKRIKRGYAIPLMFLCAATPIPDDQLLLLLGYAGYSIWKMLVTYFFGKIALCLWTSFLIIIAWDIPAFEPVFSLFGIDKQAIIEYDATGQYESTVNPWLSFAAWLILLVVFIAIFYFDWKSIFKKLLGKKNSNAQNGISSIYLQLKNLNRII